MSAAKKRAEKELEKVNEKIKNKDFDKNKRSLPIDENALLKKANPTLWKKTMDAIGKRDDAKHELELLKRKDELKKKIIL